MGQQTHILEIKELMQMVICPLPPLKTKIWMVNLKKLILT